MSVLAIVLAVLLFAMRSGHTHNAARTLAFSTLVVANIGLILTNRSWSRSLVSILKRPNRAFWWVLGGAAALLATAVNTPFLRSVFHFEPLNGPDIALCLAAGAASILWFEIVKRLRKTKKGSTARQIRRLTRPHGYGDVNNPPEYYGIPKGVALWPPEAFKDWNVQPQTAKIPPGWTKGAFQVLAAGGPAVAAAVAGRRSARDPAVDDGPGAPPLPGSRKSRLPGS